MARCEDCLHFGICKLYTDFIRNHDCELFVGKADVVPKSEVYGFTAEELAQKCESFSIELEAMRTSANSYKMHYENAKQEVAREIFELIDCAFSPVLVYNGYTIKEYLAELKKKYTEEKQ